MKKIFILLNFIYALNYIILPFKKENKINSLTDFIFYNRIISEINLGSPSQKIKIYFTFERYSSFIASKEIKNIGQFNKLKSKTYEEKSSYNSTYYFDEKPVTTKNSYDIISFNDNKNAQFKFNFNLIVFSEEENQKIPSGIIGLKPEENTYDDENILIQLIKQKIINDFTFTIKFKNNEKGEIIIGDELHNFDEHFKEEYLVTFRKENDFTSSWQIIFDHIKFDLSFECKDKKSFFDINLNGFIGTEEYETYLNETYFLEYYEKKICEIKYVEYQINVYRVISCKKKLKNFNLDFDVNNVKFSFNENDLFTKFNNNYIFNVIFSQSLKKNWHLGQIFLKKYLISFNQERKIFGYYTKQINNKKNKNSVYIIIFLIFCVFIFAGLFYYFLKLYINRPRKNRANELEENFTYDSKYNLINNNKNMNKLGVKS